jgi:hypothetical protein
MIHYLEIKKGFFMNRAHILLILAIITATAMFISTVISTGDIKKQEVTFDVDGAHDSRMYPILTTQGNSVGIDDNDTAALIDLTALPTATKKAVEEQFKPTSHYLIITSTGKVFSDVGYNTGSATGTPGYLSWQQYIGTLEHESPKDAKPGEARRTDFCIGECKRKTSENRHAATSDSELIKQ